MERVNTQESRVRRLAHREGYRVRKSRRALGLTNKGMFMLVDTSTSIPVLGWDYDAALDDIEEWLRGGATEPAERMIVQRLRSWPRTKVEVERLKAQGLPMVYRSH